MKKIILLLLVVIAYTYQTSGQQSPEYSMYMLNPMLINPAVAGSEYYHEVKVGYRNQYTGLTNSLTHENISPRTFYLSGHAHIGQNIGANKGRSKLEKQRHHGIGGLVTNDVFGSIGTLSAYVIYAYNITLTKDIRLSFGAGLGFKQWSLNGSSLASDQGNAGTIAPSVTKFLPDANAGAWLHASNFFLGLSASQIFQNQFNVLKSSSGFTVNKLNVNWFLYSGYNLKLHKNLFLTPSFLIKYVNPLPATFDVNLKAKLIVDKMDNKNENTLNYVWGGISYRHNSAVFAMAGFSYQGLYDIGISYDYITSNIGYFQKGSIELYLGMKIQPKQQIVSPSDFW